MKTNYDPFYVWLTLWNVLISEVWDFIVSLTTDCIQSHKLSLHALNISTVVEKLCRAQPWLFWHSYGYEYPVLQFITNYVDAFLIPRIQRCIWIREMKFQCWFPSWYKVLYGISVMSWAPYNIESNCNCFKCLYKGSVQLFCTLDN